MFLREVYSHDPHVQFDELEPGCAVLWISRTRRNPENVSDLVLDVFYSDAHVRLVLAQLVPCETQHVSTGTQAAGKTSRLTCGFRS